MKDLRENWPTSVLPNVLHCTEPSKETIQKIIQQLNATTVPKLYVILPDQQVPYHDKFLHELVLRWLETNQPHGKIYSGDLVDLPGVSRYDWNPEMDPDPIRSTSRAVTETIKVLQEYSQAGGVGDDWLIEGNHELRLFKYLVSRAPELFYLQEENGEQTLDLYRLLGLQKLGINLVPGRWPQGKHWISPKLAVIHGRYARQGSGVTARATLKALGHSVIMGHSHRQSMIYETQHPYGGPETRVAVEAGTLAMLEGGLGYSPEPDWQQGFCTARIFGDGTFHISLATYTKGALFWEGQVYRNTGHGVITSV